MLFLVLWWEWQIKKEKKNIGQGDDLGHPYNIVDKTKILRNI